MLRIFGISAAVAAALSVPLATSDAGAAPPPIDDHAANPHPADLNLTSHGRCDGLDHDLLDVDLDESGELTFVYAGDDYSTCDEVMVVTSYASAGPEVDNHHDTVVDEVVFQVAELEAAGVAGVTVEIELDECWAGVQVLRDGDTFVFDEVIGDGCEMQINSTFAGSPFLTEIHVVQQSGTIEPPHIFDHDDDEETVLTGLPNGTWYVKIHDGAHPATTMALDGGAPLVTQIVNGVPDGSVVDIVHPEPGRRSRIALGIAAR